MKKILLILFLLCNLSSLLAQNAQNSNVTDTNLYILTKIDGTEYIGKVLSDDGREVLILTEKLGKIYIPKSDIKSLVILKNKNDVINGEYHGEGPFTTRHSFTTNALPIKKGENYAMINLFGPEVHFAITDHFNFGIMSTWMASPLALAAKYTVPSNNPKVNFSLGTLLGTSGYFNNFANFGGLHFGNVTYGDRKNNITFSAGYGYLLSAYDDPIRGPIISIGGISKVGAKASFIFDSMFGTFTNSSSSSYSYNALFIMPGMRFQTKENRAFQISLAGVAVFDQGDIYSFPIPMLNWFYKF
jgi:hypothetical protein